MTVKTAASAYRLQTAVNVLQIDVLSLLMLKPAFQTNISRWGQVIPHADPAGAHGRRSPAVNYFSDQAPLETVEGRRRLL